MTQPPKLAEISYSLDWRSTAIWLLVICCVGMSKANEFNVSEEQKGEGLDEFLSKMQSVKADNCKVELSGPGVVQDLARDRFKRQAMIAVARANLLTYLWKYNPEYFYRESVLYWLVTNLVESDNDIFAAGNCYDLNQFKSFSIFCPYAFRNKADGSIIVKDLAKTHHYDEKTEENQWFQKIRDHGLEVIERTSKQEESVVSFFLPNQPSNKTYTTLIVDYDDGHWSMPYFDCGGGNIWMITYTIPFFGYDRRSRKYVFKGTSGIDIDLMRVDINQCPQEEGYRTSENKFAGSHKCRPSTYCSPISGLGFQRGSYKCFCKRGYYFPATGFDQLDSEKNAYFFNGTQLEEEYYGKQANETNYYDMYYDCLPCAPGCDTCVNNEPCLFRINWMLRIILLSVTVVVILSVFGWSVMVALYQHYKVIKAASPFLLQLILAGAMLSYIPVIVHFFKPNPLLCTLQFWFREIGFSVIYSSILLKTWRIAVVFRPTKYRNVRITDIMLLRRVGLIVAAFALFCAVRTILGRPEVIMIRHSSGKKTFSCSFDVWDYSVAGCKLVFLFWGIWLSVLVHKTPSEFNESRFISWAIYNETILSLFFNISMLFLHSSGDPDLFYILVFLHSQLTVTGTTAFLFASKAFHLYRSIKGGENPRHKRRRFVPALTSKSSVSGSNVGQTFLPGHTEVPPERQLSVASGDLPSFGSNGGSVDGLDQAEGISPPSSKHEGNDDEQPSNFVPRTNDENTCLLPKLTELQVQIETLKAEVNRVRTLPMAADLGVENGKEPMEPTADGTTILAKTMNVDININGIATPSKSRSESSCRSPSSGTNTISSRTTDDGRPYEYDQTTTFGNGSTKIGVLAAGTTKISLLSANILEEYPDQLTSSAGRVQNGLEAGFPNYGSNDHHSKVINGNGMPYESQVVSSSALDNSIVSSNTPPNLQRKIVEKPIVANGPRSWSKRNGKMPSTNALLNQEPAHNKQLVVDMDNGLVDCVQYTCV